MEERIAGVDEVGRGPIAGPVVAAAVILDPAYIIEGLADSKRLAPSRRSVLASLIQAKAWCVALGRAEVEEIDAMNIHRASLLAMQRAISALEMVPTRVLVDGVHSPQAACAVKAIVRGDASVPAISAASIVAKVARDSEMERWDTVYPGYGFARHKGYGTRAHLQALRELGATPLHRRSFAPVKNHPSVRTRTMPQ